MRKLAGVLLVALTGGCSSIVEGTSQQIVVNTSPAGADCTLTREGIVIGRVNPTPGAVTIKKTKHDIQISCAKDGFIEASYFNKSDVAGATVGNILLGGGIGWAVDSASGADNKYESPVNITLVPTVEAENTVAEPAPVEDAPQGQAAQGQALTH